MKKNNDFNKKKFQGLTEEEINSPEFDPEEFAPEHKNGVNLSVDKRQPLLMVFFSAFLALIIALLGMVAGVGGFKDGCREKTVLSEYKNFTKAVYYESLEDCDVYVVYLDNLLGGIGVFHTVPGFGGNIEVLVCFGIDNKISSVKVVNHNESYGVGDRITDKDYLKGYDGLVSTDDAKGLIISGATESSLAVKNGVEYVLALKLDIYQIANALGVKVATAEDIKNAGIENDDTSDTTGADTTGPANDETTGSSEGNNYTPDTGDIDRPNLNGVGGGDNNNNGGGNMGVDGSDVTTVYDTETDPQETTETPAETTEAPIETTAAPETTAPAPVTTAPPDTTPEPIETDPVVTDPVDSDTDPVDTVEP